MIRLEEKAAIYVLFAVVVLACALGSLSQTATNSMLTSICADFSVDLSFAQLLTSGYMLIIGITVPLITYLSRRLSTRSLVFLALGLMAVGSIIDIVAVSFPVLFCGRLLQAVSTGITLPFLQAIAMVRFPAGQHATAMGIGGIAMGFAPNIGPSIGGALVETWGWRSFFVLLLAVTVALCIVAALFISRDDSPGAPASLDIPSFVLSTVGFGGILVGLTMASSFEPAHPFVWAPIVVGVIGLIAFIRRQKRISDPLISMEIFGSRHFSAGLLSVSFLFANFMGITLIAPLFVTGICGGSALDAGIVFVPATVVAIVFNPLSGMLADRFGTRPVCIAGSSLLVVGSLLMAFMDAGTPIWLITLFQTVRATGVSSLIGPLTSWSLLGLIGPRVMDGSAFLATVRQVCASLGVACMIFIITALGAPAAAGLIPTALPYQAAFGFSALCSLGCFGVIVARVRDRSR